MFYECPENEIQTMAWDAVNFLYKLFVASVEIKFKEGLV